MSEIKVLFCAKGYYVLQHIRIWRISEETHFCENGQYSRPLLHKCEIQYTNAETYAHIARWGCEIAVGRNASSLSLSSLCGYRGQELIWKSIMIHSLTFHLPHLFFVCIYHSPFQSPFHSSLLFSLWLLPFSPPLFLLLSSPFPPPAIPSSNYLLFMCGTAQHVTAQLKHGQEG